MLQILEPGKVYVWHTPLSEAVPSLRQLMSTKELERLKSFRKEEDRKRALISYGLLRLILAQVLKKDPREIMISRTCPHCGKEHGRPQLKEECPESIEISVSHSGQWVVIALSLSVPIGIDVEEMRTGLAVDQLASQILSPLEEQEFTLLTEDEKLEAFYVYWTRKEAILKAFGLGFSISPKQLSVSGWRQPPRLISWEADPSMTEKVNCYSLHFAPEYKACLSVIGLCNQILLNEGATLIRRWEIENQKEENVAWERSS
ncbi:4'-phosphopantetheinyl transferase family protein [Paenactinomyces guangxiensis]|uniref:4'-phosphopantetheinyl transferase superfamily protein n=1 Tax=Paenactinomyces guangxiensis TaxID=1490290 RepID=A0A7W2A8D2_9BACL|nr:4'-phosphopantetheinyl transferase superfamily protein [Paenactinomyces guangxiensis]MBA4494044.1 4'-phosphopantetheinyl transferase superfamily protein [Paenactinomyces guangxiensis]MBH8591211.1 4'-phosphopantetheinyl transferase superfamily protein [Paenactinomyces guangxiensis]